MVCTQHEISKGKWLTGLLDGGGIRGYSSLLILEAILARIEILEEWYDRDLGEHSGSRERKRPWEYFDYIFGTSTGGSVISPWLHDLLLTLEEIDSAYAWPAANDDRSLQD